MRFKIFNFLRCLLLRSQTNNGFTLLELTIVFAITAILAGILLPSFFRLLNQQRVNLIVDEVSGIIRKARYEALLDDVSQNVVLVHSVDGLLIGIYPRDSSPAEATWHSIKNSVGFDRLYFDTQNPRFPEKSNTITFNSTGTTEDVGFKIRGALAGNNDSPVVDTMKCLVISNVSGSVANDCGILEASSRTPFPSISGLAEERNCRIVPRTRPRTRLAPLGIEGKGKCPE
jgi:prepilin-type N-terminal cleavage/methylation domain-containing protein